MFRCNTCGYASNRKYNLQKHSKSMHSRDATDEELIKTEISSINTENSSEITGVSSEMTEFSSKNTQISSKITQISSNFEEKSLTCPKCQKSFKTFHGFKKHQNICKGVSNILECHFCHSIFATYQSKSKHIKICKIRKAQEQIKNVIETLPVEYNTITNNNNTNNANNQQIIYNICNYRISKEDVYSSYNPDDEDIEHINDFGKEDLSYILPEKMHQYALHCDFKSLINEIHFNPDHPENHNIRKNCSKSYKVLKDRKWQIEHKDTICLQIYDNTKTQVFLYAYDKLLHKEFNVAKTEKYEDDWEKYDGICKKTLLQYIDIRIKDIIKQKTLSFLNKNKTIVNIRNNEIIAIQ